MPVPDLVRERLGDEEVESRVPLGGDDELVVTPSRTLIYRAEGLLSGESVEEHSHEADSLSITEKRRKSTIHIDHGLDGESAFTVPNKRLSDVLRPVLWGVFAAAGVIDPDESIEQVYRLEELTLVIADARVIKHVGADLWNGEEYESFAFEDVTGLDIEEGSVSSQVIVEVDGRPERIKTPSGDAREIREQIEKPLLAYHGVESYAEFVRTVQPDEEVADDSPAEGSSVESPAPDIDTVDAEGAVDDPDDEVDRIDFDFEFEPESGAETSAADDDIQSELASLRAAVEEQNDRLEQQRETIERLIEELRRGR